MATLVEQPGLGQDDPNRLAVRRGMGPPSALSDSNGYLQADTAYMAAILESLQTMRDGDFSVRLPVIWTGLAGKDRRQLQ